MKAVVYTRFSSDRQREASSEDQARNCRRRAESEGWRIGEHYRDEGISGSTADRPGYKAMLRAAQAREFDVLLVDDLSRLSRDQIEFERTIRRLEFAGIRIVAVADGYDSQNKARKVQRGFKGLMNEVYLDDLRDKTHRGQEGQALKQFWVGGRPYGYRLTRIKDANRVDAHGEAVSIGTRLEIDPKSQAVVVEIYRRYADGASPRAIADELNRRGIPSPGSTWRNRKMRRTAGWLGSAVKAILCNELYRGSYVWNRTAWEKDPDTGKRRRTVRPKTDWICSQLPELQIVKEELWRRVQARHAHAAAMGANVREGIRRAGHKAGPNPRYLFSSLLKCGLCGGSMVIVGGAGKWKAYGCASHKDGGPHACGNGLYAKLHIVEDKLLSRLKDELLSDEAVEEIERRYAKASARQPKRADAEHDKRIRDLRAEVQNLTDAVASGALRTSKSLGERLQSAEAELERLTAENLARSKVIRLQPARIRDRIRQMARDLAIELGRDVNKARGVLRTILGNQIPVVPHESGKHLVAKIGLDLHQLCEVSGSQIFVVAGAGFEPATFGL